MFAGHIGAALAIGRAERSVNVGVFIVAALLLDSLLWLFVLLGWESVTIPADFANTHQAEFAFPYSHGLVASVVWSALAGMVGIVLYSRLQTRWRAAALVAIAVFSHWVLDALVHRPELPLAGSASHAVGFGLWNNMPLALTVETAIVVVGLFLFVSSTKLARSKSIALVVLCLVVTAFTALGMTMAPAPPSAMAMATSSLGTLALACGLAYWLGRPPKQGEAVR
jgi:hypothetical protein